MSLSPSVMEEPLLFVGKLEKYIHCTLFCPSFEYKMFIDCSLLMSNFMPFKVSANNYKLRYRTFKCSVNSGVCLYGSLIAEKKLLGGAMFTCVHSIKVVHAMQGLLYAGQSFLYISSVCMTVAERHYCLFLGLSVIELVRKFRHRVSIVT